MFGTEALDVVIGLTFIYLLFSLFVSIANEMLSQLFQIRGKELKFAIERMLSRRIRDKIYDDSKINRSMFRSSLFYGSPLWGVYKRFKGIGDDGKKAMNKTLPSQIEPSTFSEILVKLIKKDVEVLNSYIKSIEKNNPLILSSISDVVAYLSVPSHFEALLLEHDQRKAQSHEQISVILDQQFLIDLLLEGHQNLDQIKTDLEKWYDEVMVYTSEWYKSKLKFILIGLGFFTAVLFNVDSISIFKTLANNEEARALVVQQAQDYVNSHESENGFPVKISLPDSSSQDSTIRGGYALRTFLDDEFEQRFEVQSSSADSASIDSIKQVIHTEIRADYPTLVKLDSTYQTLDALIEHDINQLSSVLGLGWKEVPRITWDGSHFWKHLQMFFGWIITAIAISMGAPFWFDLLKKVVNLKNEISKPKKTESKS